MKTIIVSDIFGKTPAVEKLASQISSNISDITILDPYQGNNMMFQNEKTAYTYFQKNIGIEQYQDSILKIINQIVKTMPCNAVDNSAVNSVDNILLLGFSIGASSIWKISDTISSPEYVRAICFYGSQIRYYLNINPKIKMNLIFPESESHFDVKELISQLSLKKNVKCKLTTYLHGFMNKNSVNFNKTAYANYVNLLQNNLI